MLAWALLFWRERRAGRPRPYVIRGASMDEKGAGAILIGAAVVGYVLLLEVVGRVIAGRFATLRRHTP